MSALNKKIKVLHITFDMTIGGAQQVILQLVENMDANLVEAEIACIDNQLGEFGQALEAKGFNVHLFQRQPGFDLQLIKSLKRLIQLNGYDVVHCHQYTPYTYGLLAALLTKARVIFTEHGRFYPDYGTWKRKLLNPVFSLFTKQITSISSATKDALVEHENFSAASIQLIYNGITDKSELPVDEAALKKQFSIPLDAFIFGTISRLQPIKNQQMMIKAFKQVSEQHPKAFLLIVGDGDIKPKLENLVAELGLQQRVCFAGFQSEAYRFHKIIDVFLLSSFSEGASMTLLEAMSFSKPVVATDVGGNPEIIQNNDNGFLVESDNSEHFAQQCMVLLNDASTYEAMSVRAKQLFLEKFTLKAMCQSFQTLYRS